MTIIGIFAGNFRITDESYKKMSETYEKKENAAVLFSIMSIP